MKINTNSRQTFYVGVEHAGPRGRISVEQTSLVSLIVCTELEDICGMLKWCLHLYVKEETV